MTPRFLRALPLYLMGLALHSLACGADSLLIAPNTALNVEVAYTGTGNYRVEVYYVNHNGVSRSSVCTFEAEKETCGPGASFSRSPNGPLVWTIVSPPTNVPPASSLSFRAFKDNIPLGQMDLVPLYWIRANGNGWASYSFPSGTPILTPEDLLLRAK